jgi:hypothetical protein
MDLNAQTIGGRIGISETNDFRGVVYGGYVTIPLRGWFSLQYELLYSRKVVGYSIWTDVTPVNGQIAYVDHEGYYEPRYLEVPLLATVDVPWKSWMALRLAAGPSISMRVNCEYRHRWTSFSASGEAVADTTWVSEVEGLCDRLENPDFGAVLGGGVGLGGGRMRVVIDVRYSHGLVEIHPGEPNWRGSRNHTFALTVGVGYHL